MIMFRVEREVIWSQVWKCILFFFGDDNMFVWLHQYQQRSWGKEFVWVMRSEEEWKCDWLESLGILVILSLRLWAMIKYRLLTEDIANMITVEKTPRLGFPIPKMDLPTTNWCNCWVEDTIRYTCDTPKQTNNVRCAGTRDHSIYSGMLTSPPYLGMQTSAGLGNNVIWASVLCRYWANFEVNDGE